MAMRSNCVRFLLIVVFACLGGAASAQQAEQRPSEIELDETVKIYCDAWSEKDIDKRRQLLERVWVEDGTYTDPVSHVEGRDALVNRVTAHLEKFPGTQIVPSSHADLHHGMIRFTWKFIGSDGKIRNEGIDFGEITSDGRLRKIVGFFGPVKPLQ
jgi:SnoaL-like protein